MSSEVQSGMQNCTPNSNIPMNHNPYTKIIKNCNLIKFYDKGV